MKKLNKVAVLFASAALAAPLSALAQSTSVDNYRNGDGSLSWKNGSGEQCCVHTGSSSLYVPHGEGVCYPQTTSCP